MLNQKSIEVDTEKIVKELKSNSYNLESSKDLDPLLDYIGDAQYILLGEATHGTHEYYTWRTAITKRLIREKKFSFIGVEGDWPDCYQLNRYIKNYPDAENDINALMYKFIRWPVWMWANWEIAALIEWLKEYNSAYQKKIGFYGLDVYSLWESMSEILNYLQKELPEAVDVALRAYQCFEPYGGELEDYAMQTRFSPESCEDEVVNLLIEMQKRSQQFNTDPEASFNIDQNAQVMVNAERYYRAMIRSNSLSWNIRDHHMADTFDNLINFHGKNSKGIIWAHNTHIGDARFTDMKNNGMENIGQIIRERKGKENVVLIGFGSYAGSLIAGKSWGAPMEIMRMPDAKPDSYEELMHCIDGNDKLFLLKDLIESKNFSLPFGHRAIGVVYDPDSESYGNYVPTILPRRYDAFVFIDETKALHPIQETAGETIEPPETFPFGI